MVILGGWVFRMSQVPQYSKDRWLASFRRTFIFSGWRTSVLREGTRCGLLEILPYHTLPTARDVWSKRKFAASSAWRNDSYTLRI